ncbi:MAG: hypothetical protein AAF805_00125 [Planctomycetota bacterium]
MNERLRKYLESIGLAKGAENQSARDFFAALKGTRAVIANLLNYQQGDTEAQTSCDAGIRGLGYDPADPTQMLAPEAGGGSTATATAGEGRSEADGGGQRGGTDGASTGGDLEAATRRAMREERERIDRIRALAETAGATDELVDRAVNEEITVDAASSLFLEHMRSRRTGVDADLSGGHVGIHSRGAGMSADALVALLLMDRCNINDPTRNIREYDRESLTWGRAIAADDQSERARGERLRWERASDEATRMRSMSMVDIAHRGLQLSGIECQPTRASVMNALDNHRSALANSAFSGIYTQAFGAAMLDGYERAPDSTEAWTFEDEAANYFAQERVAPTRGPELTKQGRGGVAEMADYGDRTSKLKVDRFSRQWALDEMDWINDTFGASNGYSPDELGEAAKQVRPNLAYAKLLANPVMDYDGEQLFSVAHGNIQAGGLTKANLQLLIDKIALQTERETLIQLRAAAVMVAHTKRFDLAELLQPMAMVAAGGGATAERLPAYNALANEGLASLSDARLDTGIVDPDTGNFQAGNADLAFAMAQPSRRGAVVAYLRGSSRSPEQTTEVLMGGMFGLRFITKLSIGFAFIGHEGFARLG